MSVFSELIRRTAEDARTINAGIRVVDGDEIEHRETYGKPGDAVAYFRDDLERDDEWVDGGDPTKVYAWAPYIVEVLTFANPSESNRQPTQREQNDRAREVAGIVATCILVHGNKLGAPRRNMSGKIANDPGDSGTATIGSRYLMRFDMKRTAFDTKATLSKAEGSERTAAPGLTGNGEEGC